MLGFKILKRSKKFCIPFFILFASFSTYSKASFTFSPNILKAQNLIFDLKLDEAEKILVTEAAITKDNLAIPWLQEYVLFYKNFILEEEILYNNSLKVWDNCIASAEKIKTNDAWHRFVLSDMYLHRALVKLKMEANISAGNDLKKAYTLLKENEKLFYSFLPDNKNFGLIQAAISSVPKSYSWLTNLMGFEGNLIEGSKKIEAYLNSEQKAVEHINLKIETAFIFALLQHHLQKNANAAWKTITPYTMGYKTSMLQNYMRATIANYAGKNDEVINIISQKPSYSSTFPFYFMDYLLGCAKLKKLDTQADIHFKIYTIKFKGKQYKKSAYRYLAWSCILQNDLPTADIYYTLCSKNGSNLQEEDNQAQKEAKEIIKWPAILLKPRLLFDGKYYGQSLTLLNSIKENDLIHLKCKLELLYRKARVYHETNDYANALLLYDKVIKEGTNESYYYAAYATLQMGFIYEFQKKNALAIQYYKKAKNDFSKNLEYRNSIEQKAKAGIKRLGS
ncbi:MAG: hypothetical protein HQ463_01185 [Bacteroidetes bacterium]|nr:hypothetical protein [Bacteroidota bacterium]